jgi:hypothetical protein
VREEEKMKESHCFIILIPTFFRKPSLHNKTGKHVGLLYNAVKKTANGVP